MYSNFPPWGLVCRHEHACARAPSPNAVVCVVKALIWILVEHQSWILGCPDPECGIRSDLTVLRSSPPLLLLGRAEKGFSAALKTLKSGCWLAKTRNYCVCGLKRALLNKARLGLSTVPHHYIIRRRPCSHQVGTMFGCSLYCLPLFPVKKHCLIFWTSPGPDG